MRQALLLALLPAAAAQTADELLRSARDLARAGCTMKLPKGEVNHGGHRRMQLGLGGLSSSTCELATLQNQAAAVDAACCPNDSCDGGIPSSCDYACAVEFVPFWTDCGSMLMGMGQDMSSVNAICTPRSLSGIQKAVDRPNCPNEILSCSHPSGVCVDAAAGGGASPAELADCTSWTSQGGGWTASGEACTGITGNIVVNGGFESPALGSVDCQGGHDSSFRGDDHCQYKYIYPLISEACHADCQLDSWQFGEADVTAEIGAWIAVAENGNDPWGGLDSHMGRQYIVLQHR